MSGLTDDRQCYNVDDLETLPKSMNRSEAIEVAIEYTREYGLTDLNVEWAEYQTERSVDEIEALLSRRLTEDQKESLQRINRNRWVIQLVYEPTPPETTPDGPCVLIYDDGQIDHFYPM